MELTASERASEAASSKGYFDRRRYVARAHARTHVARELNKIPRRLARLARDVANHPLRVQFYACIKIESGRACAATFTGRTPYPTTSLARRDGAQYHVLRASRLAPGPGAGVRRDVSRA